MNLRSAATKKWEATIIVVLSTALAILSADHFERTGPHRELLKQLKEMQEARHDCHEKAEVCPPMPRRWSAPPAHSLHQLAER